MKRAPFQHKLDRGMKGWIVKTAKKNIWRVWNWYTIEDLIQEGYICFANCSVKYAHIKEQKHFMRLVQTTFRNHITDLANYRTRSHEEVPMPGDHPIFEVTVDEEATLAVLVKQLPDPLQRLLYVLMEDAKFIPRIRYGDRRLETTEEYLQRLSGIVDPGISLVEILNEHFSP